MAQPGSFLALRRLLFALAMLEGIGGLVVLLGSSWVLSLIPATLRFAAPGLDSELLKVFGAVALTLAYLLYSASRDPVRYVAVVDGFAFLLIAVAGIDLYSAVFHTGPELAAWLTATRVVARLLLASALLALRPRVPAAAMNARAANRREE